jgi:hypothetical protein
MIGLFGWFVNDGWALSWLGGGGRKGGIFERFLDRGSTKFSAKFDAIGAYSMINKGIFEACLG